MELNFTHKYHVAGNIWAFMFSPSQPLQWTAGQFVRVEVPHPQPDAEGTKRFFTIAAAPGEGAIRIATRLTGTTFKTSLDNLLPRQPISLLDPPAGDFTWRDEHPRRLLVAQGIGITPFYSMLRDRHENGLPLKAHLIYAHHPNEIPFYDELKNWQALHPELTITFVPAPATPALLAELSPDLADNHIYISGPKAMTALVQPPFNVPMAHLKQDRFSGYSAVSY